MRIFYLFRSERGTMLRDYEKGQGPDHFLYGFNYLKKNFKTVKFSDKSYNKYKFFHFLLFPLEKFLINKTTFGFKLDQALVLLPELNRSNIIISTADSAGLPVLMLKSLKLINKPVIYISTGFINELTIRRRKFIFNIYKIFLKKADIIVCHSNIEAEMFGSSLAKSKNEIYFIPFGIDTKFFYQTNSSSSFILSIGRDRSRNYKLLSEIAYIFKKEKFILVTNKENIKGINFSSNVTIYYDIPYIKIRDLYFQAKLVLIPLKDLNRASGQVNLLESLVSHRKVVVNNVKGLKSSYADLLNRENNIFLTNNSDPKKVALVIRKALSAKTNKINIAQKYNSEYYANELTKIIKILYNDKVA